jgi:hypothetical protein
MLKKLLKKAFVAGQNNYGKPFILSVLNDIYYPDFEGWYEDNCKLLEKRIDRLAKPDKDLPTAKKDRESFVQKVIFHKCPYCEYKNITQFSDREDVIHCPDCGGRCKL